MGAVGPWCTNLFRCVSMMVEPGSKASYKSRRLFCSILILSPTSKSSNHHPNMSRCFRLGKVILRCLIHLRATKICRGRGANARYEAQVISYIVTCLYCSDYIQLHSMSATSTTSAIQQGQQGGCQPALATLVGQRILYFVQREISVMHRPTPHMPLLQI